MLIKLNKCNKQQGVATLTFSMVILFALTIVMLFGARVGLLNEKMAANDFRAQESAVTAEAGMNMMVQTLGDNFTRLCKTGVCLTSDTPYTLTGVLNSSVIQDKSGVIKSWNATATVVDDDPVVINVVSVGSISKTIDGITVVESTSHVAQQLSKTTLLNQKPASPLIFKSDFSPLGDVSIVSNANGVNCGGTNLHGKVQRCAQHVSVWSVSAVNAEDGFTTCSMGSFVSVDPDPVYTQSNTPLCNQAQPQCHCASGDGLSGKWAADDALLITGKLGSDIVAPPVAMVKVGVNFPDDLFVYLFGSDISKAFIKSLAQSKPGHYLTSCDALTKNSSGIYWVVGDCSIGNSVGWVNNPIFLVVEDGVLSTSGDTTQVFGLAYVFDAANGASSIQLSGGYWYGGIIGDNGTVSLLKDVSVIYSDAVFEALKNNLDFAIVATIPGSWRDW